MARELCGAERSFTRVILTALKPDPPTPFVGDNDC